MCVYKESLWLRIPWKENTCRYEKFVNSRLMNSISDMLSDVFFLFSWTATNQM